MTRVTDRDDWFGIWLTDRQWILNCMVQNLADDLKAGFDYFGKSATRQREEIDAYEAQTNDQLDKFKEMDSAHVNRWCYYDLIKRGAIEI